MLCILKHFPLLYFQAVHTVSPFYTDSIHVKNALFFFTSDCLLCSGDHVAGSESSWKNTMDFSLKIWFRVRFLTCSFPDWALGSLPVVIPLTHRVLVKGCAVPYTMQCLVNDTVPLLGNVLCIWCIVCFYIKLCCNVPDFIRVSLVADMFTSEYNAQHCTCFTHYKII